MADKKNNGKKINDDKDAFIENIISSFKEFFSNDFFNTAGSQFDMFNNPEIQEKLREGPVYWGYSTIIGPDGKPMTKVWGNMTPSKDLNLTGEHVHQLKPENTENTPEEPFVDIIEEENELQILAELPGVTKENIILKGKDNSLTLAAHGEIHTYSKEIPLGFKIDPKSIKAHYNNGVLEIKVPISKKDKSSDTNVNLKVD